MMEKEMTRGRAGGIPSDSLDSLLGEISRISSDIVVKRKEILSREEIVSV
jgi:hypothetical protein